MGRLSCASRRTLYFSLAAEASRTACPRAAHKTSKCRIFRCRQLAAVPPAGTTQPKTIKRTADPGRSPATREFITVLGSTAALWPLATRAQPERVRRVGMLLPAAADDPEFQTRVGAFVQELALLRWTIGRNVRIDTRWATSNAAEIRRHAAELAPLAPAVILGHGAATVGPLLQTTRSVPIVFAAVGRSPRVNRPRVFSCRDLHQRAASPPGLIA
jgi:hypothetical protein